VGEWEEQIQSLRESLLEEPTRTNGHILSDNRSDWLKMSTAKTQIDTLFNFPSCLWYNQNYILIYFTFNIYLFSFVHIMSVYIHTHLCMQIYEFIHTQTRLNDINTYMLDANNRD